MAEALEDRTLPAGADRPRLNSGLHIEVSPRRVRAFFGGQPLADSTRALLVFETRRLPVYYFPFADVRMDLLRETDFSSGAGETSELARWTLEADGRTVDNVGWSYRQPDAERARLKDHIAFYWNKLENWFEEDDEVFVHPRDPYHRVDVLNSSRHVKVVVEGQVVAETHRPRLLFETSLPTRYYIPKADVRMDLLEPTQTSTQCPYKGQGRLLVCPRRRQGLQGFGVGLPVPDPRMPQDREPGVLLQREGRPVRGRRAPGPTEDAVVLSYV
jgi:uncharacterized protein (DUF427 family)